MFKKVESKSFTLTMLGTDTSYTPTLKNKKKTTPLKVGTRIQDYYPKGETLSIVSTLIKTEEQPAIDSKQLAPYQSLEVSVVNGPKTDGGNVGEKIGIGLGIALNAVIRGQTELNEIAHSRGGVESILIAHEINAIKDAINSCANFDQLISLLESQQTERQQNKKGKPLNNTPDIIKPLLSQLPKTKEAQEQWFNALKTNISNVSMNLFIIDPVPGDCWPVTWYDERFFTLPAVVKHAEFVYYENERSDWGFTPIYPEGSTPDQIIVRNTIPGHHGTGSAGTNASQQNIVVSPEKTKATHVQKLMLFKLLKFLKEHGVEFKNAQEIFHEPTGLGRKYVSLLADLGDGIDVEKLDFPTIFRKLYDKIYDNRAAYEAFDTTHYTLMGVAPQRKLLRTGHKYGLLTEVFPKNTGYVNEEHSFLMKEYFFKIFNVHSDETKDLSVLINSAQKVLSKNIKKISNISSSLVEHSISPAAILDNENARKDVLNSFGALIQRVSLQYLTEDWSEESKQKEKQDLFIAIIAIFKEFDGLLQIDNPGIQEFVKSLYSLSLKGITQTAGQQHANLQDDFNRLQTSTDTNLKSFFNGLLTQINKDERYSNGEINPEIIQIFESPQFAQLANYPVSIKIQYICEQLGEKLSKDESLESLVEQLTKRFEEHYGSSLAEFEKLHHQIKVFIDDIEALGRVRELATEEAVFNKHELLLRKKAEMLIDVAAQKFYRDRPNALPEPAAKGTFKELVERHAINKYGVVDRVKQEKAVLAQEKNELTSQIEMMQQNLVERNQQLEKTKTVLKAERNKKIEYSKALNDENEVEHLLLIKKKLIPLTAEYLAWLRSQLSDRPKESEQDDEIKKSDDKINVKITEVTKLLKILNNTRDFPRPKERARQFYNYLDKVEQTLINHRDDRLIRYIRNAVIAAGVLLAGLGLIGLAAYTRVGYSSVKSLLFWQSSGENVVSKLNEYRKELDIPIDNEEPGKAQELNV